MYILIHRGFALLLVGILILSCGCIGFEEKDSPKTEHETPSIIEDSFTFYVATDGNDNWEGTEEKPFRTLNKARDTIRIIKTNGKLTHSIIVYVREGTYFLDKTLIFTPEDSGTEEFPIIYKAYPGEKPIISGGQKITGWEKSSGDLWTANVSNGNMWYYFRQLFVNGKRYQRARLPNFYLMDGKFTTDEQAKFKYREENEIKQEWADLGTVEVVALQYWTDVRMTISDINTETRTITLSGKVNDWMREENARYYIENIPEGLEVPGSWYLTNDGKVYVNPGISNIEEAVDLNESEVIVPRLTQLIRFEGDAGKGKFVSHIHMEGLTFAHTDWTLPSTGYADVCTARDIKGAITADGANFCKIENCTFTHLGNYAVAFYRGCKNNTIVYNEMTDLGAGGVRFGEFYNHWEPKITTENDWTKDNIISDNHIHSIGIVYHAGVGIFIAQSSYNLISHNHIHDTYSNGIYVGWEWGYYSHDAHHNIIEFNHIHDIGRGLLSDMGGVYTLGVQPGTVVRNNLVHDISNYDFGYGGWGLYADEGSSDILFENNIVYNTKSAGFHQNTGKNNLIRNNIFAFGKKSQIMRTGEENHLGFTFNRNVVYWNSGELLGAIEEHLITKKWNYRDGEQFSFDNNIYWDTRGSNFTFARAWRFEEWQQMGYDIHSIIADPLFVDPYNYNFELKTGSPTFEIGFNPIDLSTVGPRPKI